MRIAILEDDTPQMELISRWLQMAGHQVHAFERGTALLRAVELDSFDALLLDWNIRDISGLEVLKRVRQQLRSRIPVIFITARTDEADVVLGPAPRCRRLCGQADAANGALGTFRSSDTTERS